MTNTNLTGLINTLKNSFALQGDELGTWFKRNEKASNIYQDPPPNGETYYREVDDGLFCDNKTTCEGKTGTLPMEYLPIKGKEACGEFVCAISSTASSSSPAGALAGKYAGWLENSVQFRRISAYTHAMRVFTYLDHLYSLMEEPGPRKGDLPEWPETTIKDTEYPRENWKQLNIDVDGLPFCNAAYSPNHHEIYFGICKRSADTAYAAVDGSVVTHEIGHGILHFLNPDIQGSVDGDAFHEAFATLLNALMTGRKTTGEDLAPFIAEELGEKNKGYLYNVDNRHRLTKSTSEEPHERSNVYTRFYWNIVEYLGSEGVPFGDARDAAGLILITSAVWLYFKTSNVGPEWVAQAACDSTEYLSQLGYLDNVLHKRVKKGALYDAVVESALVTGLIKDPQEITRSLIRKVESSKQKKDRLAGIRQLPDGTVIRKYHEVYLVGSGPFAGGEVVVEGYGWSEFVDPSGKRLRLAEVNPSKREIDETMKVSPDDAANIILAKEASDIVRTQLEKAGYKKKEIDFLFGLFGEALTTTNNSWKKDFTLVVPEKSNAIHYKFTVSPFIFYVNAKTGALTVKTDIMI